MKKNLLFFLFLFLLLFCLPLFSSIQAQTAELPVLMAEEMPRFPGCEELDLNADEKQRCADYKMLEFIYHHIRYPEEARKEAIEGMVVIQFVVEKDGSTSNASIVRDIGAGCGQEALRMVELMNEKGIRWIPGTQDGEAVRVQFNLPVKFALE